MPKRESIDLATRLRIAEHVKDWMRRHEIKDRAVVAQRLAVSPSTVTRLLNGGQIGLDVFIAINRKLGISANELLNSAPRPR